MSELQDLITEGVSAWTEGQSTDPTAYLEQAKALGAKCDNCPLAGHKEGPVFAEIRKGKDVLLVGDGPGTQEIARGVPFVGAAGKELDLSLQSIGKSRSDVSISNALLCRPPGGRSLERFLRAQGKGLDPISDCLERLRADIAHANPKVIVTMGSTSLKAIAKLYGIHYGSKKNRGPCEESIEKLGKQRGHPFVLPDGRFLMPTYSPTAATKSNLWMIGPIRADLFKAFRIAKEGKLTFVPPDEIYVWWPELHPDSRWREEVLEWVRPYHDIDAFYQAISDMPDRVHRSGRMLTVDIETSGVELDTLIRTVNFGFRDEYEKEVVFVVPLRFRDGSKVPNYQRFWQLTSALLAAAPGLAFQNGTFDTSHLLEKGLMKDREVTWFDTMQVHRNGPHCEGRHHLAALIADCAESVGYMKLHKDTMLHGTGGEKE